MRKKTTISFVAASLLATTLHANDFLDIGAIYVTSSSFKTKEKETTFSTEIYTQKDIEQSNSKDIYEFLNSQTSIITMPSYGNSFTQLIDLRGYGITDGYQNVVITVNGRRVNNIDMAPQLLSSIPLEDIEKIEVIKGSGSVEFGDGANAGTINIKTKAKSGNYIKTYAGNYGTKYGMVSLGYGDDKIILNGMIDYYKTDGIRNIDNSGNKDGSYNKNKNISLIYFPTDDLELRAKRSYSNMDIKYAKAMTLEEFNNDILKNKGFNNQYLSSYVTELGTTYYIDNGYTLDIDLFDEDKLSRFPSWTSDYEHKSVSSRLNIEKDRYKVSFGLNGFKGDRKGSANTTTKKNEGFFISSEYIVNEKLKLSAGGRKESVKYEYDPIAAGSTLKDKEKLSAFDIGLNYKINENSSFFTNYNKSFQAPDIDRFFTWGGGFNAFIDPAKVKTINIGYNHFTKPNKLKITLFRSDLSNEIYYYSTGSWLTSYNTNIDESHKYGLEFFDKYQINENLFTSVNYNYVIAKIDKENDGGGAFNGKDLPGVSKHSVTLNLGWQSNGFSSMLSHKYRSKAYASNDFSNSFTQKQKAYNSTDLSLNYKVKNYEFFAKAQNLFDKKNGLWTKDDNIYPIDFTRTYYAGLKVSF